MKDDLMNSLKAGFLEEIAALDQPAAADDFIKIVTAKVKPRRDMRGLVIGAASVIGAMVAASQLGGLAKLLPESLIPAGHEGMAMSIFGFMAFVAILVLAAAAQPDRDTMAPYHDGPYHDGKGGAVKSIT